jgi:hypothetical protein
MFSTRVINFGGALSYFIPKGMHLFVTDVYFLFFISKFNLFSFPSYYIYNGCQVSLSIQP